jgi:hypothetical protein
LLVAASFVAAACGTGSTSVDFDEPVSTLFSEEESVETDDGSTTTTSIGVEEFDLDQLPGPDPAAPGVVLFDGVAAPVVTMIGDEWTVASPCGGGRSGVAPVPTTALVVVDPLGDPATERGAIELQRSAALTEALQRRLVDVGVSALATRSGLVDVAAPYRRDVALGAGARVMVSVALVDGTGQLGAVPGLEIVHPAADDDARRLAGLLHAAVDPVLGRLSVGWPDDVEPGVRAVLNQQGADYFTVLREPARASRVVLHLPVDPEAGSAIWTAEANLAPFADALADAIVRFLLTEEEGTGFVSPPQVVREAVVGTPAGACVDPIAVDNAGG